MTAIGNDVHYFEVANGVQVVVKQRTSVPLVSIAIGARGGALFEKSQTAGHTALMGRTSIKGTGQRSASQIAEEAERMGGSVSPSSGADMIDWEISVPSRHFAAALDLLMDVALDARFPEAELEVERKLMLADLQHTRDDMFRYPVRLCLQTAFAGHPYGFTLDDMERGVAAATSEELRAWRNQRLFAETWVFVVGDVDPQAAARAVEQRIPFLDQSTLARVDAAQWPSQSMQRVEARDKAQTALAIAFPGPQRNDDDVHAMQVLANAVGGLGGRFFEELRSKRSLAYTVSLMPVARCAGGAFLGYIATSPEREEEARRGLFEQFDRLVNETVPDDEIERAKRYTIGTWQIRSQTNAAQLSDLVQAHMLGQGLSEITEFERRIRAVDAAQIREVARRYFKPEVAVEGIVRGTGKSR